MKDISSFHCVHALIHSSTWHEGIRADVLNWNVEPDDGACMSGGYIGLIWKDTDGELMKPV
jgi:hypothetical protein